MFFILVLLSLTASAFGVTELLTAEGANATLQWDCPSSIDPSTLILYCFRTTPPQTMMLEVVEGVQRPGPEGGQFSGRLEWDREALGLGLVRIVVARVSAQDQGLYWCYMFSDYQHGHWEHKSDEYFMLTLTRDEQDSDEPRHARDERPAHVMSDLSPVQMTILCLMFGFMFLTAFCIAAAWVILHLPLTRVQMTTEEALPKMDNS